MQIGMVWTEMQWSLYLDVIEFENGIRFRAWEIELYILKSIEKNEVEK
jgi:hypothetical protein